MIKAFNYRLLSEMKLSDLPVSILADIFTGSNSWMAIELWKTGDSLLLRKMASGGVLNLHLQAHMNSSSVWPRCLKNFRLKSLHLSLSTWSDEYTDIRPLISELHHGLYSLELIVAGAMSALLCHSIAPRPSSSSITFTTPQTSSSRIENDLSTPLFSFGSQFPQLRHLYIGKNCPLPKTLHLAPLSLLPPSLTSLRIQTDHWNQISFEGIPKLSKLVLSPNLLDEKNVVTLPCADSLTSLQVGNYELWDFLATHPDVLPNLVEFPWQFVDMRTVRDESMQHLWNPVNHQWLPNIERFRDDHFQISDFSGHSLPPTLTSLDIANWDKEEITVNAQWIQKVLPRTVTQFTVQNIDWSEVEAEIWPFNLSTLRLTKIRFIDPLDFHRLPRDLKSYSVKHVQKMMPVIPDRPIAANNFETDAKALGRVCLDKDLVKWIAIKERLLHRSDSVLGSDWKAYVAQVESGSLFGLPLSLTHLSLSVRFNVEGLNLLLPPNLTKVKCLASTALPDDKFWAHLPPHLIDCSLKLGVVNVDNSHWNWPLWSIDNPIETAMYNSKFLVYLSLAIDSDLIIKEIFHLIPPSVRHLNVKAREMTIAADLLRTLPSCLETLHLFISEVERKDDWLASVPRSITSLRGPTAVGEDLVNLPPSIVHLQLRLQTLSFDELMSLPRSLQSFIPGTAVVDNRFFANLRPFNKIWEMPRNQTRYIWKLYGCEPFTS